MTSPLKTHETADVVVVGAGFTGLSAALHLAECGIRVIVVEAKPIGFGGAGRNVGLINGGMWVMPKELPDVLGPVYASDCSTFSATRLSLSETLSAGTILPANWRRMERCTAPWAKRG